MDLISDQHAESRFVGAVLAVCSVVSVLLSLWCIHIDHVINNDGIEYIRTAERLADSDWAGAHSGLQVAFLSLVDVAGQQNCRRQLPGVWVYSEYAVFHRGGGAVCPDRSGCSAVTQKD